MEASRGLRFVAGVEGPTPYAESLEWVVACLHHCSDGTRAATAAAAVVGLHRT